MVEPDGMAELVQAYEIEAVLVGECVIVELDGGLRDRAAAGRPPGGQSNRRPRTLDEVLPNPKLAGLGVRNFDEGDPGIQIPQLKDRANEVAKAAGDRGIEIGIAGVLLRQRRVETGIVGETPVDRHARSIGRISPFRAFENKWHGWF